MIDFKCSKCGQKIKTPDGTEGRQVQCPKCRAILRVPKSQKDVGSFHHEEVSQLVEIESDETPYKVQEPTQTCPACGEVILQKAKKCKYCGEWLKDSPPAKKKAEKKISQNKKEPHPVYFIGFVIGVLITNWAIPFALTAVSGAADKSPQPWGIVGNIVEMYQVFIAEPRQGNEKDPCVCFCCCQMVGAYGILPWVIALLVGGCVGSAVAGRVFFPPKE